MGLKKNLDLLKNHTQFINKSKKGLERELLRLDKDFKISALPHSEKLGSALTHPYITTDFSEALLEFVTETKQSKDANVELIDDIVNLKSYTTKVLESELLWPYSIPPKIESEDDIPIAYYSDEHVGKMKRIYRVGLSNRYGKLMQAIAGTHFNFSFSTEFFETWNDTELSTQDFISKKYFSLIRNFHRYAPIIPYLFGATPIISKNFYDNSKTKLDLKPMNDAGDYGLKYSTCLRMSDMGYQNPDQSSIDVCYNELENYITCLRKATTTPYDRWKEIGIKKDGKYQQLSDHFLQIENEFYGNIRPKRPTLRSETPTKALLRGGVEYVEVRALDLNPFEVSGINNEQMVFIEVFLWFCLLKDSPQIEFAEARQCRANFQKVALHGRDPELKLDINGNEVSFKKWLDDIFMDLKSIAHVLKDEIQDADKIINEYNTWVEQTEKTLSARVLNSAKEKGINEWVQEIALKNHQELSNFEIKQDQFNQFTELAKQSIEKKIKLESECTGSFEDYLENYYSQNR